MSRIRKKSLIPRYPLPITKRTLIPNVVDEDNPFANATSSYSFVRGYADASTIQSTSAYEVSTLPQGNTSKEVYTIFSNTALHPSIENTSSLSDAVFISDSFFGVVGMGGWFTVIKVKSRLNNIINHYETIVSRDYNQTSNEGLAQYPSVDTLLPLIDTKAKLLAGDWIATWEGENA